MSDRPLPQDAAPQISPVPTDDGEVAAILAAVGLLLQQPGAVQALPERSMWRFAGRWWR